ncbi:MAG: FoF1 ATP synthase subunit a [bacterium]
MNITIFDEKVIKPFEQLGLVSKFWHINIETMINTWIGMGLLFILIIIARIYLKKNLNPIALVFEMAVSFFNDLCKESFGSQFKYEYFAFVSTIFFFTLTGCLVGLLPFLDESTKDLNTAFAIGTLSFLYVQYKKISVNGFKAYLKSFTQPIFILLPLNIIGELAKVASMSFRLFGNILGGSIIFLIAINALSPYKNFFMIFSFVVLILFIVSKKFINLEKNKILNYSLQTLLVAVFFLAGAQIFFGIFEGFVQSFVLTMLTITYLAVAIRNDEDDSESKKSERGETV